MRRCSFPLFVLIIFSISFLECKKSEDSRFIIKGTITSSYDSSPVSGVIIKLSATSLSGGTFNIDFESLENTTSDSQGYFEFDVERAAYNEFKLEYSKGGYIPFEARVNPDDIDLETGLDLSQNIDPLSQAEVTIRNTGTVSEDDEITFRYTSAFFPSCDCCTNSPVTFTGADIDTTLTCDIIGGIQLEYLYTVQLGGTEQTITDGIFIEPGQTGEIQITY